MIWKVHDKAPKLFCPQKLFSIELSWFLSWFCARRQNPPFESGWWCLYKLATAYCLLTCVRTCACVCALVRAHRPQQHGQERVGDEHCQAAVSVAPGAGGRGVHPQQYVLPRPGQGAGGRGARRNGQVHAGKSAYALRPPSHAN